MKRRVASCIGAICLLSAGPVAAQDYDRSGPYVGVGGAYAARWVPGDFDDDLGMGATVRVDNTGGVNARLGYRANRWLAGELEYEWLDAVPALIPDGLSVSTSGAAFVEVTAADANKGDALRLLCAELGVDRSTTIATGCPW